ncbi:hypothetical protein [Variovorax paradoxus]|uniref:hypothetical protein n=1 Tax=Variovorax paradoxus TaxID=34073 RepID=UPI001ABC7E34
MRLQYPRNAAPIVEARAKGMRPAGLLIVVMTDRYERLPNDAHVFVDAGVRYCWDWARGLPNVVVVMDARTKLGTLLGDLMGARIGQVDVVDVERGKGWLVNSAQPLSTVRWSPLQVRDWLGDGSWHAEVEEAKAQYEVLSAGKWRYAA